MEQVSDATDEGVELNDELVQIVVRLHENPEVQNIENFADLSAKVYNQMRKSSGKKFEVEYLRKRKEYIETKEKHKQERNMLSVKDPKL